ncbi:MAG TPA: SctK family type III secretion system sorting platform protein, partial [Povalibacter sp.]
MLSDLATCAMADSRRAGTPDALFELQLQFNLFPARYAHLTWIEEAGFLQGAADAGLLADSSFWIRRVSDTLLRRNDLDRQFDLDFSDHIKRLALLDFRELARIGGCAASVLLRDQLRRTVRGTQVEAIRACIGADAHVYALNWNHPVPALQSVDLQARWDDVQHWEMQSAGLVSLCIPPNAPGTLRRLWFKYPHSWRTARSSTRTTEAQRIAIGELLLRIVR